jgi:transcriptional accessory protein Tex/SPT6
VIIKRSLVRSARPDSITISDSAEVRQAVREFILERSIVRSEKVKEKKSDDEKKDDRIENLKNPGRDPRNELPKPILRSDVLEVEPEGKYGYYKMIL